MSLLLFLLVISADVDDIASLAPPLPTSLTITIQQHGQPIGELTLQHGTATKDATVSGYWQRIGTTEQHRLSLEVSGFGRFYWNEQWGDQNRVVRAEWQEPHWRVWAAETPDSVQTWLTDRRRKACFQPPYLLDFFALADEVPRLSDAVRSFDAVSVDRQKRFRVNIFFVESVLEAGELCHRFRWESPYGSGEIELGRDGRWRRLEFGQEGLALICATARDPTVLSAKPTHQDRLLEPLQVGPCVAQVEVPGHTEPRAVVVIIGGSGILDHRGNGANGRAPHSNLYEDFANVFLGLDCAVVRYPDRRFRESTLAITPSQLWADAHAVIEQTRRHLPELPLILMGHSEGCLTAVMAVQGTEIPVAGWVFVAPPALPLSDIAVEQGAALLSLRGASTAEIDHLQEEYRRFFRQLAEGRADLARQVPALLELGSVDWWRQHQTLQPLAEYALIRSPLLLIHGQSDRQISPEHSRRIAETVQAVVDAPVKLLLIRRGDHFLLDSTNGDPERLLEKHRRVTPATLNAVQSACRELFSAVLGSSPARREES